MFIHMYPASVVAVDPIFTTHRDDSVRIFVWYRFSLQLISDGIRFLPNRITSNTHAEFNLILKFDIVPCPPAKLITGGFA